MAALEYAGTEGHSGSGASEDRALREAENGTVSARQAAIIDALHGAQERGLTWHEVADRLGLHHGQATGSLSNLHKAGFITRLTECRGRSSIYVLPDYVEDRETVPQGRRQSLLSTVGYPYRQGPHLFLGPEVHATLDGEFIVWKGRRYHPVDVHDGTTPRASTDEGRRPLFDI